jgi:hypothetical protein
VIPWSFYKIIASMHIQNTGSSNEFEALLLDLYNLGIFLADWVAYYLLEYVLQNLIHNVHG